MWQIGSTILKIRAKYFFIQYDIVDFLPSISEKIVKDSIKFARNYSQISEEEEKLIISAKNSILYCDKQPWKEKNCQNKAHGMGQSYVSWWALSTSQTKGPWAELKPL